VLQEREVTKELETRNPGANKKRGVRYDGQGSQKAHEDGLEPLLRRRDLYAF
jgi:hypothetical protein